MNFEIGKKLFNIVNSFIESLEKDKILLGASIIFFIGLILITIGISKTEASYPHKIIQNTKQVWGYTWGEKAIKLNNKLQKIGYSDYQSKLIINKCKKFEKLGMKGGVKNCVIAIASIGVAESGGFKHCRKGQCMGVKRFGFKNLSNNLDDWLRRYTKYWYKWRWKGGVRFFYSLNGRPSLSRYCTEEQSSGMKRYHCPNGYKHFNYVFYNLTK